MSSPPQPTVLHTLTASALISRILASPVATPATLVICATRAAFLASLLSSTTTASDTLTPTLHTLTASSRIRLVFCPSVPTLLGWLGVYRGAKVAETGAKGPGTGQRGILYIVDMLALHASTAAYSAQGLGRCFAAAVEAAGRAGEGLAVVECVRKASRPETGVGESHDEHMDNDGGERAGDDGDERDLGMGEGEARRSEEDPWEQEVPILNTSMRRLGSGSGERGWAGRTVKVRTVAERWFVFEMVEEDGGRMDEG